MILFQANEVLRVIQLNTLEDRNCRDKRAWDTAVKFLEDSIKGKLTVRVWICSEVFLFILRSLNILTSVKFSQWALQWTWNLLEFNLFTPGLDTSEVSSLAKGSNKANWHYVFLTPILDKKLGHLGHSWSLGGK